MGGLPGGIDAHLVWEVAKPNDVGEKSVDLMLGPTNATHSEAFLLRESAGFHLTIDCRFAEPHPINYGWEAKDFHAVLVGHFSAPF